MMYGKQSAVKYGNKLDLIWMDVMCKKYEKYDKMLNDLMSMQAM